MKLRFTGKATVAVVSSLAMAVTGIAMGPAHAAKSSITLMESTPMTGLNSSVIDQGLTSNADIGYMTGFGFSYFNETGKQINNTIFGTYKIVKNTKSDFRVQYTVNPGRVWSDGTPIDGVDLLFSHVVSSSKYSIAAGLGDPADTSSFASLGYAGVYDNNVFGEPTLSADHMSVTVRYSSQIPDWSYYGPGPTPVHALELMVDGKTKLGTAAENAAAKAKFLSDFTSKNTSRLKAMGKIWSEDYNIQDVNSSTNPLLLISNGDYIVESCVKNQNCTLVENKKANSGPDLSGITKLVYSYVINDSTATQALANGELDLYGGGAPTPDVVAAIKKLSGITTVGGDAAGYEHVDLKAGDGPTSTDHYTGIFSDATQGAAKALALRTAFLLALPRQDIVDKLVKPTNSNAVVMNSVFVPPSDKTGYAPQIAANGTSIFSAGSQASRTAQALKIVQRYYPKALKSPLPVRFIYSTKAIRASEMALIKAEVAKAGFAVSGTPDAKWSSHLAKDNGYDASLFAWGLGVPTQDGLCALFQKDGGYNVGAWNDATLETDCKQLQSTSLPKSAVTRKTIEIERALFKKSYFLPLYQSPAVTAYTSSLSGVKPSPFNPVIAWNYWEWHF